MRRWLRSPSRKREISHEFQITWAEIMTTLARSTGKLPLDELGQVAPSLSRGFEKAWDSIHYSLCSSVRETSVRAPQKSFEM